MNTCSRQRASDAMGDQRCRHAIDDTQQELGQSETKGGSEGADSDGEVQTVILVNARSYRPHRKEQITYAF